MKNDLLVSIVIPLYNVCAVEHKFRRCIEFVRAQTFCSWELILVNDSSTDATADIIQPLTATDKRIRILTNQENRGRGMARNAGTNAATGDYIIYCDQDDCMLPHTLQTVAHVISKHNRPDVIQFKYIGVDETVAEEFLSSPVKSRCWWKRGAVVHRGDGILRRFLYGKLALVSWARAIRVDLARRVKFTDSMPEDVPHSLELFAQADTVVEIRNICHVQVIKDFQDLDTRKGFSDIDSTWHNCISHLILDHHIAQRMPGGHLVFCLGWTQYSIFLLEHFQHGDEEILIWGRMVDSMNINLLGGAALCTWRDMRRGHFSDGIKNFVKIRRYYRAYQRLRKTDSLKDNIAGKSATDSSSATPDA